MGNEYKGRVGVVPGAPLTAREKQVLLGRADGLRNTEIAELIGTSEPTVKEYSKRVLVKLGAKTMAQAVAHAYHSGLFKPTGRKVIQINRAQVLGFFNLSQALPIGVEMEMVDQDSYGHVFVRAGERRFRLERRGGWEELASTDLSKPRTMGDNIGAGLSTGRD